MHETRSTALRAALTATQDFRGITGVLSCDPFGDWGTGRINICHHRDRRTPAVGNRNDPAPGE